MRLILVRHCETRYNRDCVSQGYLAGGLTTKGKSQAKKVRNFLKKEKIDYVYCSPLERTRETLVRIQRDNENVRIIYSNELSEHKLGSFEGKPSQAVVRYCKKHNLIFRSFRPEGGESVEDVRKRVIYFYKKCLKNHKKRTVLFISHGSILLELILFLKCVSEKSDKDRMPKPGEVNILKVSNHKVTFEVEHWLP